MQAALKTLAAGVAAVVLVALAACSPSPSQPEESSTLTIGVPNLAAGYDPRTSGLRFGHNKNSILEPLFVWNQDGNTFDPWLASDWTISEDGLSMEMTLRDDVDFADGTHMDAAVVEDYFGQLFASETYGFAPRILGEYDTKIAATGEYTLEITTKLPIGFPWFEHMSYTPVISPNVLGDADALNDEPLGFSGPYDITEFTPDVEMTLERRADYWNEDAFPYQTVILKVFTDPVAALNALKSGQIDVADLTPELALEAESDGFAIHTGEGIVRMLFISDRAGQFQPALADPRVRQAMNLAFDKEAILENVDRGFGTASSQAFLPVQDEFLADQEDRYAYDLDEARRLMAEAGYADGFSLTIPTVAGVHDAVVPIVEQSLADIGITATFEEFPDYAAFVEAYKAGIPSGKYTVLLHAEYNISLVRDWLAPTGAYASASGYSSPEVVDLLAKIQGGSADERVAASQELGQFLLDEAWFVPFSKPQTTVASIPEVTLVVGNVNAIPELWTFRPAD